MYDGFSADYDRFVNWPERLVAELPFVECQLQAVGARRVLDAACGTGMHALALARRGYEVMGTDLSAGMIAQARANAAAEGVAVRFEVAGFGKLARVVGDPCDAVLCMGNSLPHLLTPADLAAALADFAASLRPGGLLLVQNRNFDRVLEQRERWMEPQTHREGEREWLFLRFYDFEPGDTLAFNVVTLQRDGVGGWRQHVATTRLWPMRQADLIAALRAAGFDGITCWGDMQGSPFELESSGNLVVVGRLVDW